MWKFFLRHAIIVINPIVIEAGARIAQTIVFESAPVVTDDMYNGQWQNDNQKPFEKMIIMKYDCVGIGVVKMTVGVRRRTHEKVQYCITALTPIIRSSKKSSHK